MSENRIYVASLSDYNNGTLHGEWIDVDDVDTIQDAINEMLESSPYAAKYDEEAEEWAIHDYEGPISEMDLGENPDLDELVDLVDALEEHGEAFGIFYRIAGDLDTAKEHFEDAYQGEWSSEQDFAEDSIGDCYDLSDVPDFIKYHIDWAGIARDLFISDYTSERMDNGKLAVFRADW